jgi:hypothetical protein
MDGGVAPVLSVLADEHVSAVAIPKSIAISQGG